LSRGGGVGLGWMFPVSAQALAFDMTAPAPLIRLVASAADTAFAAPRTNANAPARGQLRSFDHSYAFREDHAGLAEVAARLEDETRML